MRLRAERLPLRTRVDIGGVKPLRHAPQGERATVKEGGLRGRISPITPFLTAATLKGRGGVGGSVVGSPIGAEERGGWRRRKKSLRDEERAAVGSYVWGTARRDNHTPNGSVQRREGRGWEEENTPYYPPLAAWLRLGFAPHPQLGGVNRGRRGRRGDCPLLSPSCGLGEWRWIDTALPLGGVGASMARRLAVGLAHSLLGSVGSMRASIPPLSLPPSAWLGFNA